jgi:ribosomal protein L37AE/L43A
MGHSEHVSRPAARTCQRCGQTRPDVREAADVKLWLCNSCWVNTPPGMQDRGKRGEK